MLGSFLVRILLSVDASINARITGLELVWSIAFAIYFVTSVYLSVQSLMDRHATHSADAGTRRTAALTRMTADHFVVVSTSTIVIAVMGLAVGIISLLSPSNPAATEQQRIVGALTRLTFVVIALALTTSNLTLVHWRRTGMRQRKRTDAAHITVSNGARKQFTAIPGWGLDRIMGKDR
jgi:hypothetical protein